MSTSIPTPTQKLLTKKQAAEYMQVSERTITRWIDSGQLRARKFGKSVRIEPAAMDAFIAAH